MRSVALNLILLTLVGAALPAAAVGDRPAPPDYYPLKEGNTWHFRMSSGKRTAKIVTHVAKIEKIDGQALARVETILDGKTLASEHLRRDTGAILRCRFNGVEVMPAFPLLKLPARKGDTWKSSFQTGDEKATATSTIGEETVEVPAGKYKTLRLQVVAETGGKKISTTYWFAAGVGIVRQTIDLGGFDIRMNPLPPATLELEKFQPGK